MSNVALSMDDCLGMPDQIHYMNKRQKICCAPFYIPRLGICRTPHNSSFEHTGKARPLSPFITIKPN